MTVTMISNTQTLKTLFPSIRESLGKVTDYVLVAHQDGVPSDALQSAQTGITAVSDVLLVAESFSLLEAMSAISEGVASLSSGDIGDPDQRKAIGTAVASVADAIVRQVDAWSQPQGAVPASEMQPVGVLASVSRLSALGVIPSPAPAMFYEPRFDPDGRRFSQLSDEYLKTETGNASDIISQVGSEANRELRSGSPSEDVLREQASIALEAVSTLRAFGHRRAFDVYFAALEARIRLALHRGSIAEDQDLWARALPSAIVEIGRFGRNGRRPTGLAVRNLMVPIIRSWSDADTDDRALAAFASRAGVGEFVSSTASVHQPVRPSAQAIRDIADRVTMALSSLSPSDPSALRASLSELADAPAPDSVAGLRNDMVTMLTPLADGHPVAGNEAAVHNIRLLWAAAVSDLDSAISSLDVSPSLASASALRLSTVDGIVSAVEKGADVQALGVSDLRQIDGAGTESIRNASHLAFAKQVLRDLGSVENRIKEAQRDGKEVSPAYLVDAGRAFASASTALSYTSLSGLSPVLSRLSSDSVSGHLNIPVMVSVVEAVSKFAGSGRTDFVEEWVNRARASVGLEPQSWDDWEPSRPSPAPEEDALPSSADIPDADSVSPSLPESPIAAETDEGGLGHEQEIVAGVVVVVLPDDSAVPDGGEGVTGSEEPDAEPDGGAAPEDVVAVADDVGDAGHRTMLREVFAEELAEINLGLGSVMLDLTHRSTDRDAVVAMRRAFHTVKGSGRIAGYDDLANAAYGMESAIDAVLDSGSSVSSDALMSVVAFRKAFADVVNGRDVDVGALNRAVYDFVANTAPAVPVDAEAVDEPALSPDSLSGDAQEGDAVNAPADEVAVSDASEPEVAVDDVPAEDFPAVDLAVSDDEPVAEPSIPEPVVPSADVSGDIAVDVPSDVTDEPPSVSLPIAIEEVVSDVGGGGAADDADADVIQPGAVEWEMPPVPEVPLSAVVADEPVAPSPVVSPAVADPAVDVDPSVAADLRTVIDGIYDQIEVIVPAFQRLAPLLERLEAIERRVAGKDSE